MFGYGNNSLAADQGVRNCCSWYRRFWQILYNIKVLYLSQNYSLPVIKTPLQKKPSQCADSVFAKKKTYFGLEGHTHSLTTRQYSALHLRKACFCTAEHRPWIVPSTEPSSRQFFQRGKAQLLKSIHSTNQNFFSQHTFLTSCYRRTFHSFNPIFFL